MSLLDAVLNNGGGGSYGGGGGGSASYGGGDNWRQFSSLRDLIAQRNQQMYGGGQMFGGQQGLAGYQVMPQQSMFGGMQGNQFNPYQPQQMQQSMFSRDEQEEKPKYRQMTDLERFSAGARKTSDDINNAVGNFLFGVPDNPITGTGGQAGVFGKPEAGADLSAIKLENVPRMLANMPGMIIGSVPDVAAYGSELIAGTPAMEGDLETGQIQDRKLTAEERGADIAYTGLSALSMIPGLSIESKLAGTGMKAAGKASGKKLLTEAGNMAAKGELGGMGAIERSAYKAGKRGSDLNAARWKDAAVGAGASALFEGFQEAGQTAAEDVRYHRFDLDDPNATRKRVFEGGFWGSLMGGIAGGAPGAIGAGVKNYRANRGLDEHEDPLSGSTAESSPFKKTEKSDWDELQRPSTSGRLTPGMRKYYDDLVKADSRLRADGAVNLILKSSDNTLPLDAWRAGVDDFIDAWNQGDNAKAGIARQMSNGKAPVPDTIAIIDNAINNRVVDGRTYDSATQALNAVNRKFNGSHGYDAAIEKRPGAKYTGGYGRIVEFVDGRGFVCNPALVKQINADFDSDMGVLHLVTRSEKGAPTLNLDGKFGEKILSPEGSVLMDFYYTDFTKDRFDAATFKGQLFGIFEPYANNKKIVNGFVDRMVSEMKSDKPSDQAIGRILEDVRQTANSLKRKAVDQQENGIADGDTDVIDKAYRDSHQDFDPKTLINGSTAVSNLFVSTKGNTVALDQLRARGETIRTDELRQMLFDEIMADDEVSEEVKAELEPYSIMYAHGTVSGSGHTMDVYDALGLALHTLETAANQPFRQYGQLGYNHAKMQEAFKSSWQRLAKAGLKYDVIDAIVRCSFRIARVGTTPLDAIEGLIDSRIVKATESRFGLENKRIASEEDFDLFEDHFADAWDEGAKDYRSVHMIDTVDGQVLDPTAPKRNDIKGTDRHNQDMKLLGMFADHTMDSMFDEVPPEIAPYSVGEVVKGIAERRGEFNRIFANSSNPTMNNVMDRLVKAYLSQKKGIHKGVISGFKEMNLSGVLDRKKANGGKIHASDWGAVTWYVNSLVDYITPEGFHYLGITDPIDFIENTEIGNRLLDSDWRVRFNTFYALLARAKFGLYQDAINGDLPGLSEEEAARARENAILELGDRYLGMNGVVGRISAELIANDGKSNTLDVLTSMEGSFDEKENLYKSWFGDEPGTDLLVDMLVDSNDDFSISTVSKKSRTADQSMANYQNALFEDSRKSISAIKDALDMGTISDSVFSAAMNCAALKGRIDISDDAVPLIISNSLDASIAEQEKGTEQVASASFYEGGVLSALGQPNTYVEQVTAYAGGAVSADNLANNPRLFLSIMSGQTAAVRVYDGARTRYGVDRDWIFSQVSDSYDPSIGPVGDDWIAFLERFPQYEAYFAGLVAQPVVSGGEGSAVHAKTSTLYDEVFKYNHVTQDPSEGEADTIVEAQKEHARSIARNEVLLDGRFPGMVVAHMGSLADPENASLTSITGSYKSISRKLVDQIMYDALNEDAVDGDVKYARRKQLMRQSTIAHNIARASDAIGFAKLELELYGGNLFNMRDNINTIVIEANKARLVRQTTQDIVDEITSRLHLDHIEVGAVTRTDGVLSEGEIELMQLQLMAEHNMSMIEQIIRVTSMTADDIRDVGQVSYDPLFGLADSTAVSNSDIVKEVEKTLKAANYKGDVDDVLKLLFGDDINAGIASYKSSAYSSISKKATPTIDLEKKIVANGGKTEGFVHPVPYIDETLLLPSVALTKIDGKWVSTSDKDGGVFFDRMSQVLEYIDPKNAYLDYQADPSAFVRENFYDQNGVLRTRQWHEFVVGVNNRVVELTLKETNDALGMGMNENALMGMMRYFDAYDEIVGKVRKALNDAPNPYGVEGDTMYMPTLADEMERPSLQSPSFDDRTNQGCITQLTTAMSGSPIPGGISRNGGYLKKANAMSFLPADRAGSIQPVLKTKDEIDQMRLDDEDVDQWICVKEGEWEPGQEAYDNGTYTVTTVGAMLKSGADISGGIQVFDPEDNPHGMWVTNTPASITETNRPSLRLSSINGGIIDTTQEAMLLKLKKRFEERIAMVDGRDGFGSVKPGTFLADPARAADPEYLRTGMVEVLKQFRRDFASDIKELFDTDLKDTGYGKTQALIYAQGLTPGMVCKVNGKDRCISAETLFNPESFATYVQTVVDAEGQFAFEKGEAFIVAPSEIHSRIDEAVEAGQRLARSEGSEVNWSQVQNDAYGRCTSGWDTWLEKSADKDNQLSIDEIFSHGTAIGWRRRSLLTPETAATTFAKYMDIHTAGLSGSVLKPTVPNWTNINVMTDKSLTVAVSSASNKLGINVPRSGVKVRVLKAFISDKEKNDVMTAKGSSSNYWEQLDSRMPDKPHWDMPGELGVCFCIDENQIDKALRWAEESGNALIVPERFAGHLTKNRDVGGGIIYGVTSSIYSDKFVLYDTRAINIRKVARKAVDSTSSVMSFDPDAIEGVCLNQKHVYNPGDATLMVDREFSQQYQAANASKQSVRGLTNGIYGKVSAINSEDAADELLDALFDEDGNPKSAADWRSARMNLTADRLKDVPLASLQQDIREFLQAVKDGSYVDQDGFNRRNAGRNKILGMLVVDAINGDRAIVPVLAPNNSPKKYASCSISVSDDGNIYIRYNTTLNSFGEDPDAQYFKATIPDMSFKGVIALMPEKMKPPTFVFPGDRENVMSKQDTDKIKLITSWDTVKSRLPGRERQVQISDMWYFSKKYRISYLYERDGSVKKYIADQYVGDDAGLNDLLQGRKKEWDRVARGEKTLHPDPDIQAIHKQIVRNYGDKVNLALLFSPGWDAEGVRTKSNIRFYLPLNRSLYNRDRVLKFFHGMNDHLCPNGIADIADMDKRFMFDDQGRFKIGTAGDSYWEYVKWGEPDGIGAFSELAGTSSKAGESHQAFVRLAMDKGYNGRDRQMAIDYATLQAGDPKLYRDKLVTDFANRKGERIYASRSGAFTGQVESLYYGTRAEREQEHKFNSVGDVFLPENRRAVYYRGKEIDNPFSSRLDGLEGNPVADAVGNLQGKFQRPLSHEMLNGLSYYETGHTYNDGKGDNKISLDNLAKSYIRINENIEEHGLPIVFRDMYINNGRIPQPLINKVYAREVWNNCEAIRNHPENQKDGNPDFDTFVKRMMKEQEAADQFLHKTSGIRYRGKKRECLTMSEYNWRQWGMGGKSGIVYEYWTAEDLINTTNWFAEPVIDQLRKEGFDPKRFKELNEQSAKLIADTRARVDGRRFTRESPGPNSITGKIGRQPTDYSRGYHKVFRYATDTTRLMGVLDIFLTPSNILYRGVNQSIMGRVMSVGRKLVLGDEFSPDQSIIRSSARNDSETKAFWGAIREAAFQGDQDELFAFLQEGGTVKEYFDMKADADTPMQRRYQKMRDLIYKIAAGGDVGIGKQVENFLNRITFFFNEDPQLQAYWLKKDPATGLSRMETMLNQDGGGARFLQEVFTSADGNISYLAAMNAMESTRTADIAQRHILIEMFKNATNRHPIPEFLATTLVSRYPRYALNFMEECINLILPMSTLRHCFISFMAEVGHAKAAKAAETGGNYVDPHYEELLRNTSVREAALVDAMHFGAFGMLCILAGLPGAVEPPEDEKKWGNYKEWLILQHRVGEAWWVEDIFGIVAPAACFWKSVQLGKPRFDLIFNGIGDICYNNPMIKISDAMTFAMDPFEELETDYEMMAEKYGKSPDGKPGFMDYISSNFTTFGLSYASQFFTPTFLKTVTNWATPYELDYKNVYKENVRGVLTEKGASGEDLVRTSYDDAMLRRLTRRNPALALIMDLTHPGSTSYSGIDAIAGISGKMPMPYTRYLDQHQYDAMKAWSIQGMSEQDAQAKTMQILSILMEYQDDLDALTATGFYLDYPTKQAVSSMIWDTYYQLDKEWQEFQKSDYSDYKVLGNGDWNAGKALHNELYGIYQDNKRAINDFYYKVMKSKDLSQPITEYRRYNTTYAQDDDGNWYATGFHPQGAAPFVTAPGTLTDPEGTAGYENDFVTVSAVTGQPLENMRALVPANEGEYLEWPDLKEWADNGDGEGYSKVYQQWYGNGAKTTDGLMPGTSALGSALGSLGIDVTKLSESKSAKTPSYGGKGGGGGRRGGGGGGGGGRRYGSGVPNAYAPSVSAPTAAYVPKSGLSKVNISRTMSNDRLIKPDEQYLRPDFETKGSREAYKRSDI